MAFVKKLKLQTDDNFLPSFKKENDEDSKYSYEREVNNINLMLKLSS